MPIKEQIKISDEGVSTLKKIRDEHRSFKEELKSTKKELKETWDKKYKPTIESTTAMKSIKSMQNKADDLKDSLNTKIRLNDDEVKKLNAIQGKLKAFGRMVVSPLIKIKGTAVNAINTLYQKMLHLGKMVVTPIVKIKDAALSKLKSSVKLFQEFGKKAISPIIRIKDYASDKVKSLMTVLNAIGKKVLAPVIKIKNAAITKLKQIQNILIRMKNTAVSVAVRVRDFAAPKLKAIRDNLIFLAKLSIQPAVMIYDLATASIKRIKSGLISLAQKTFTAIVNLKGNAIKQLKILKTNIAALTRKVISPVVRLKDNVSSKVKKVTTEVKRVGKIVARPVITLKDNVSAKLSPITSKLKGIAGKGFKATITAVDKTASGIASATKKVGAIAKKVAIPVTIAATVATAAIGASVKSGMELENQQISIKHFIGATNKNYTEGQINEAAQSFTDALRENANATPFETGEVISAGSRAVAITQGNTKQALSMVKLAEDMAAASGGTQSVGDAIEALADAKLGEMERLKSFGFKVSAEEFKSKGFEGVSKDLEGFFGGAAGKLATSGSGLLSTITGKLKSGVADFGLKIVDQLKPVLVNVIGFVDKIMPAVEKMGTAFGESLGNGIKTISSMMPIFVAGFKQMMPTFQVIISGIQQMMPPILTFGSTLVGTIKNIVVQATPVISTIIQAIARILPAVQPIFSTIVGTIGNIISTVLPPLGTAFSMIADVIVAIAPVVQTVFGGISEFLSGAISGISGIIQGGLDLISSLWSGNWQGVVDSFQTIFGSIAEICKAPVNAVISILNSCIDAINSVSVDIPDYVPFIGGNHLGFSLDHIPMLAKGGIVKKATTAVVGEAGKEAVMPLERNTGWIGQLAGQLASSLGGMTLNAPMLATNTGSMPVNQSQPVATPNQKRGAISIVVTIAKLADQIVVHDQGDIDNLADAVAQKIIEVAKNL